MNDKNYPETELNDDNFSLEVDEVKDKLIIVDFWAVWCGPCQMMSPIINELASEYQQNEKIRICKLNVDRALETTKRFMIRSVPTIKFFLNGEEVDEITGVVPKNFLKERIETNLKKLNS